MTIAIASGRPYLHLDTDLPLLVDAAERHGIDADVVAWDDEAVTWSAFDLVLVRSCWDYVSRREEFLTWADGLQHVANPAPVLRWNTDKVYLRELAGAGVPVVDTAWDVGPESTLPDADEWVVKPSISAGSRDTARWSDPADVRRHAAELMAAGRTAMVQPYVPSVDTEGETALLFLGGRFSHAIRKGPLLQRGEGVRQDRDGREVITPRAPTASQHDVAEQVLAAMPPELGPASDLAYARVDLVTGPDGKPRLIELELTEPSLFLRHTERAADQLIEAVFARVR